MTSSARAIARSPITDGCVVETIADPASFVAMDRTWNDVVERAHIPHPFLRHEWIHHWWQAFGAGRQLHILVATADQRTIGIAPLFCERSEMFGVPIRRLALMHNDHTPRCDLIVAEQPERVYPAFWRAVWAIRQQWDVLQLNQLPPESAARQAFADLAAADACVSGVWANGSSPYIAVRGTWDDFLARRSAKFRQNLRNRLARLAKIGEPRLEVVTGGDELEAAFDDVLALEDSGWKQEAGTAIASDHKVHKFYRELTATAAARGWLRIHFLTVNGRRIAMSYSLLKDNRLFICKTGYDPAFDTCSPFKVLASLIFRRAFDDGLTEVDLLGDPEPWKLDWTQTTRGHDWLFVFSGSVRARLLYPVKFGIVPALKRSGAAALWG